MGGSDVVTEARWKSAPSGRRPGLGRRLAEAAYVLVVAAVAAFGFYSDTTATILLAVLLALPAGGPALVGFYMAYGMLAQLPGANPDSVRMNSGCPGDGDACFSFTTGEPAEWFLQTTDLLGVLALAAAAALNVVFLRMLTTWRRNRKEAIANPRQ